MQAVMKSKDGETMRRTVTDLNAGKRWFQVQMYEK
jgi:hypothetical protein